MNVLSLDNGSIVMKISLADFRNIQSAFSYLSAQYSHCDSAILNIPLNDVTKINQRLDQASESINQLRTKGQ